MVLQSSQNWTGSISRQSCTSWVRLELARTWRKVVLYWTRASLVVDREGQERRKVSTVPLCEAGVPQHSGKVHSPSLFHGTQWPESASTLYLPDRRRACVVAFSTSQGEDPHDLNRGWHLVRPKNLVFKYCREERESALVRNLASQYWRTADLAVILTCSLVGWEVSQVAGWGSPYCRQSCLSFQNQEREEGSAEE